ncbi:MAG: hypothetical protein QW327_01325 [Candidatus Odinarchaeota archaeon]
MWSVKLEYPGEEPTIIKLTDSKTVLGSYTVLKNQFFNDLYRKVSRNRNYYSTQAVKNVTKEDGEDWSDNSWFLIMARDKNNLDVWLLLKQEPDGSGRITGIGPDEFTNYIKDNKSFPFYETVEAIIRAPKKWIKILVLVN